MTIADTGYSTGFFQEKVSATNLRQPSKEDVTFFPLFFTVQKLFEPSQSMEEQFLRPSFYLGYTVL